MSTFLKFESLGDNCEMGFFLRNNSNEESSFFRWVVTPVNALINVLDSKFNGIYSIENLEESSLGMVRDTKYDLCFHSQLSVASPCGGFTFLSDKEKVKSIYENEKSKIDYLVEKFQHSKDKIFVIKANSNLSMSDAKRVKAALDNFFDKDTNLLVVVESLDKKGEVEIKEDIYFAYITRFAPYDRADDICDSDWESILSRTETLIGGRT